MARNYRRDVHMANAMTRVLFLAAMPLVTLFGCASALGVTAEMPAETAHILSGEAIFGTPVDSAEAPDQDILAVDDAMRAFAADDVNNPKFARARLKRLLAKMTAYGYFSGNYDAEITQTAAATFHRRNGNCLSYTNMFVALAREVDLDARYQLVDVPPSWDLDANLLIRSNHINAVIRGMRSDNETRRDFTVDFSNLDEGADHGGRLVTDRYAQSLFYANLAVEALRGGADRQAFAYLKKGIEIEPGNADLWVNVGVLYARHGRPSHAVDAYSVALNNNPHSKSAMTGLAAAYEDLGEVDLALMYALEVESYRRRNPFYKFARAQEAYDTAEYDEALRFIQGAIRQQRANARFYFMRALVQSKLGEGRKAHRSMVRARRYGTFDDLAQRYANDLHALSLL